MESSKQCAKRPKSLQPDPTSIRRRDKSDNYFQSPLCNFTRHIKHNTKYENTFVLMDRLLFLRRLRDLNF